jgi:predicted neuraminidase
MNIKGNISGSWDDKDCNWDQKPCHIFQPHTQRFDQCHAATLVRLDDGGILTAWFGGTKEGNSDIALWMSVFKDGRWSVPRSLDQVRDEPHWNPVLFRADNRIYLFFKVGRPIEVWETWVCTSEDQGKTWSTARELVAGNKGGRGPVKNKPIVLSNGDWLAPASIQNIWDGCKIWDAFMDISSDRGQTWEKIPITLNRENIKGFGLIQPTVWESQPGCVHAMIRSSCGYLFRSDSRDFGRTWCPAYQTSIPSNNSGIDLDRLSDGTLVMAYNPVAKDWGKRTPLRVALSQDNGKTWPRFKDIETGEGEYSYPSVIAQGQEIFVVYTWKRRSIRFWHGTPMQIVAGEACCANVGDEE